MLLVLLVSYVRADPASDTAPNPWWTFVAYRPPVSGPGNGAEVGETL